MARLYKIVISDVFSGEFDRVNILMVNQIGTYLSYLEMTNLA